MPYDPYRESVTDAWDWAAQCALWRSRAIHQAERAERFRLQVEALKNGTTLTKETK